MLLQLSTAKESLLPEDLSSLVEGQTKAPRFTQNVGCAAYYSVQRLQWLPAMRAVPRNPPRGTSSVLPANTADREKACTTAASSTASICAPTAGPCGQMHTHPSTWENGHGDWRGWISSAVCREGWAKCLLPLAFASSPRLFDTEHYAQDVSTYYLRIIYLVL